MLRSLRFRLLLTLIGLVVVAVGTVALFASRVTSRELQRYVDLDMERNGRLTDTLMSYYTQHKGGGDPQSLAQELVKVSDERTILSDGDGKVLADSAGQLVGQMLSCDQAIPAVIITVGGPFCLPPLSVQPASVQPAEFGQPIGSGAEAGDVIFFGASFSAPLQNDLPISTTLTFEAGAAAKTAPEMPAILIRRTQGQELDPIEAGFLSAVNRSLLWSALAAGAAALLLTLALSRRILGPVEALTAAARGMEHGDLSQRVQVGSHDEIGELAHAFNAMADGLARQEHLRRNMVTDVAHELRTPLTNIRGYLEALRDGVARPTQAMLESLHEEALLLNHLVDDLQDLAMAEAGQLRLAPRPAALAEIVEQATGALQPAASEKDICIDVALPPELPLVWADPERVGQIVRNLLTNAITHTPPGGTITVAAAVENSRPSATPPAAMTKDDRQKTNGIKTAPWSFVVLTVRDTGSGIAPEQHGGRVWVESRPGVGACFSFTLPCVSVDDGVPQAISP